MNVHPSAFELDLAVLGEESTELRSHVEACARCRGQLETLRREQETFATSPEPERAARLVAARMETRRARWRWWPAPVLVALAASVAVVVLVRVDPLDGVRVKGAPSVEAFVKAGDAPARRLAAGERLGAGDRVQLAYQAAGFTQVTLFVLERGCEAVTAGSWKVEQAEGVLPSSWALTGEGGGRLYVAFSRAPVPAAELVAALRGAPRGCESDATPELETGGFIARGVAVLPRGSR